MRCLRCNLLIEWQTVRDGGGFHEFGISSCSQTLFDSFSSAAGWGGMVTSLALPFQTHQMIA